MGRYGKAFKDEAMKLVTEQGYKVRTAALKLGIPATTLDNWLKASGWAAVPEAKPSGDPEVLQVQLRAAQARVKELEVENEVLKKATAYFARQNL